MRPGEANRLLGFLSSLPRWERYVLVVLIMAGLLVTAELYELYVALMAFSC